MRFRCLGLMVLLLVVISTLSSVSGDGRIVAFGGWVQEEYEYPEGSFAFVICWTNVVYRDNSTLMFKVLPDQSNDLYLVEEGKQNDSFHVEVSVSDGQIILLEANRLSGGRYSREIHVENGRSLDIVVYIRSSEPLARGSYCMRFIVASQVYESGGEMNSSIGGLGGGALAVESISTKQYVVIGPPVEPEPVGEGEVWPIGLAPMVGAVVGLSLILLMGLIRRWKKREASGEE